MASTLSARPLRDTRADAQLFVNREYELKRVRRALDADLNVLMLGSRRSGRTTFLRHVAYLLRTDWRRPHVFIEGGVIDDPRAFLSLLQYRLLGDQAISAGEALAQGGRAIAGVLGGDPAIPLATPRQETEEFLALYSTVHAAASRKPGCVVLVDELRSAEVAYTIFGRFRDETWSLPLRWVVAGDLDERGTYLAPPADAFFEVVVELSPLSDEDAAEVLRRRLGDSQVTDKTFDAVVRMANGNPHRLLSAARRLIVDGVSLEDLEQKRDWQTSQLAALGPAAHRLLDELHSSGPASASDPNLLTRLGWTRGRAAQVFGQLERAGLVRSSSQRSPTGGPERKVFEPVGPP